jgi:hypothetical protein
MQSNQSGTLSLLKVTVDRLAYVATQFLQSLGLSEDAVSDCPSSQAAFIRFLNNNQNLVHHCFLKTQDRDDFAH